MAKYEFSDLISKRLMDRCQKLFVQSVGYNIIFMDEDGNFILKRGNESFGQFHSKEEIFQHCFNGGHFIAPILVKGEEIGYLILGNVVAPQYSAQKAEMLAVTTAEVLSEIAEGKVLSTEAARDMERAANMKTDFLANMSHEIRTPMNAVIGMAEMTLREDLPPKAREYVAQIKSSGNALLTIINDILDFSKIDSGKMEIHDVEYNPADLIKEVGNVCVTRLKDKPVELILDVNPKLPKTLYGDNIRVRQIMINLMNNAIKFTNRGNVTVSVDFVKDSEDDITLKVAVKDTGIGIKENDLKNLFQSFQQVDSKRNRNIEGTGLGLAISKQLLLLMHGSIAVDSEYGKGSNFHFELPQKVMDWTPSLVVDEPEKIVAIGYFNDRTRARSFFKNTDRLGIYSIALTSAANFDDTMNNYIDVVADKKVYFFFYESYYDESIQKILDDNPTMMGVMMVSFYSNRKADRKNLMICPDPSSVINVAAIFNGEESDARDNKKEALEFNFTAPDAEILIVDDNEINLQVTQGLLEPLNMNVDTATSGKICLTKLNNKKYDIIFMDHMMPEMDGVETTRIIRRLHPSYNDVPIVALTANAVGDVKELFMKEGMNDFVAKPIELRVLVEMIRKWLPPEKIINGTKKEELAQANSTDAVSNGYDLDQIMIGDLDLENARKMLNNDRIFWKLLKGYYANIEEKAQKIQKLMDDEAYDVYTIEVHALKSLSRQIGATKLASMAEALEKAGHNHDIETIHKDTAPMLHKYESYIDVMRPYCEEKTVEDQTTKAVADKDSIMDFFKKMSEAIENLDMDEMEQVISEMNKFRYEGETADLMKELATASENMDVDECESIMARWMEKL